MKLENFFKPIENKSIEEHEQLLGEKMLEAQIEYIDRISSFKIKPLNDSAPLNNIKELLLKHTSIKEYFFSEYEKRIKGDLYENENWGKVDDLFENILKEINQFKKEDSKNWKNKAEILIKEKIKSIGPIQKKEINKIKEENKIDLIHFDFGTSNTRDKEILPILKKIYKELGLKDEDSNISIHFESFYKKHDIKLGKDSFKNSLKELAVKVIDNYPETKFIFARSWLMDTEIPKDAGFNICDKNLSVNNNDSFWGQFIDSRGQIKEKDLSKFLETGIPKYAVASGFIKIEDFLGKYLPEERKGLIKLKDLTQESIDFRKDVEKIGKDLKEKWDKLSLQEIFVIINSNKLLSNYFKTKEGQEYIAMLEKVKEQSLLNSRISFNNLDLKNKKEIKDNFDKFIEKNRSKFTEREVNI